MKNPLENLNYGWHVRRTLNNIVRRLKDSVVRQGTVKALRYARIDVKLLFTPSGLGWRITGDKVARIIERGFKSYNWGARVLQNNKGGKNKFNVYGQIYRLVSLKDRLLNKNIVRAVSQRKIVQSGYQKWRMPSRKGEGLMKAEFQRQKSGIKRELLMALLKDKNLDRKRKKA